jgi:hypothetical protein
MVETCVTVEDLLLHLSRTIGEEIIQRLHTRSPNRKKGVCIKDPCTTCLVSLYCCRTVFRIRDILVQIRILGSVPLIKGSGS